ncbi:hypothetical protein [Lysinibacillus capsici]|nr:hypothetical protein [Lysinibacillus capsici]
MFGRIEARRFKFTSVGGIIVDVVNERALLDEKHVLYVKRETEQN